MMNAALKLAKVIASKSPVAIQGTKVALNFSRDHSVADGLNFMVSSVAFIQKYIIFVKKLVMKTNSNIVL